MQPLAPDTLLADGRYRLVEPLGQGGMAEVWLAWDDRLSVHRAIKLLATRYQKSSQAAIRFEREARVMAQLEHPHIVPVHDVGTDDGRVFIVMSLLDHSLQDELEDKGQLPASRVVRMTLGVLDALAAAHDADIVHRDIKPHNVLVDERDAPRLTDFGIATDPKAQGLTRTGAIMGTLAFMAPEQRASARQVDGRADLYAVGALVYALCTGADSTELDHPDGRDERLASLPANLVPFVERSTRRRASERYLSAHEALDELRDVASTMPDRPSPKSWRQAPRERPTGATMDLDDLGMQGQTGPTLPAPESPAEAATIADPQAATVHRQDETELMQVAPLPEAPPPPRRIWPWMAGAVGAATALCLIGSSLMPPLSPGLQEAFEPIPATPMPAPVEPETVAPPALPPPPEPATPPVPAVVPEPAPAVVVPTPAPAPAPATPPVPAPAEPAPEPADPPPEPAPPEPSAATGQPVRVAADPSSTLYVDGEVVGATPWRGTLPVGPHALRFEGPDGTTRERRLVVVEDGPNVICIDLAANAPCSR